MLRNANGPPFLYQPKSESPAVCVPDEELAAIRAALETRRSVDRTYSVDLVDSLGIVCANVEKVIYVRRR